jgi:hypothetical protein
MPIDNIYRIPNCDPLKLRAVFTACKNFYVRIWAFTIQFGGYRFLLGFALATVIIGSSSTINAGQSPSVESLLTQLKQSPSNDDYQRSRLVPEFVRLGKPSVYALEQALLSEPLDVGSWLCQALGDIGDTNSLKAIIRFIRRDLESHQVADPFDPSYPANWQDHYTRCVLPAALKLGDIPPGLLEQLRQRFDRQFGTWRPFFESLLAEREDAVYLPLLVDSCCSDKGAGRSDAATRALLQLDVPIPALLIQDLKSLDLAARLKVLRWLVCLADSQRTRYLVSRQPEDLRKREGLLRLTEADANGIAGLAGDQDPHTRFHVVQALRLYLREKTNLVIQATLDKLKNDTDPSVRAAADPQSTRSTYGGFGSSPFARSRRIMDSDAPARFDVAAPPARVGDSELRVSMERTRFPLDAPLAEFNPPVWLALEFRKSGAGTPENLHDLALRMLIRNACGEVRERALYVAARREPDYFISGFDAFFWPRDAASNDWSRAYVKLMVEEIGQPGEYQLSFLAHQGASLTETPPIPFEVTSTYPPAERLQPDRRHFNVLADNPYARVLWRTFIGGAPGRAGVVAEDAVYWPSGNKIWVLDKKTGQLLDRHPNKLPGQPDNTSDLERKKKALDFVRELPFGETGKSYLIGRDRTVVLWDGTNATSRLETGLGSWLAASRDDFFGADAGEGLGSWLAASRDGRYLFGPGGYENCGAACYDTEAKRLAWETDGQTRYNGTHRLWGMLVTDSAIYGTFAYGCVVSINPATGKTQWLFPEGSNQGLPPVLAGKVLFVSGWGGNLWALRAEDGRLLWVLPMVQSYSIWQIAAENGIVYVVRSDGFLYAIQDKTTLSR